MGKIAPQQWRFDVDPLNYNNSSRALPQFPSYYLDQEHGSYVYNTRNHHLSNPFHGRNHLLPSYLQSNPSPTYTWTPNLGGNRSLSSLAPTYLPRNTTIINLSEIADIMKGEYGQSTFETILNNCEQRDIQAIVFCVARDPNELVALVKDYNGCESLQMLISKISTSTHLYDYVISALFPRMLQVMTDPNGHRLLKYCSRQLKPCQTTFICQAALIHFETLARDRKGYIFLLDCVRHSGLKGRFHLLRRVVKNSLELARDRYGNFVIQAAIGVYESFVAMKISLGLRKYLAELCMSKTGSHVMQRCLESPAGGLMLRALVDRPDLLEEIATNEYGNYVIQTALKAEKDKGYPRNLFHAIDGLSQFLNCHPYAINVVKVLEKLRKQQGHL